MKIKLRVTKGSSAGKEVKIPTPKCLIGRGEDCHMRPKSDAISRRHCAIFVKNAKVYVRDLKSKNGTFVNEEQVEGDRQLASGDVIKFGPLSFEIVIDHSLGGAKKPKVTSIKEAAARTTGASPGGKMDESSITDWLTEADDNARANDPETRQFKLDETAQKKLQEAKEEAERIKAEEEEAEKEAEDKEKKEPGKLPEHLRQKMGQNHDNSRDAAADMLKKFFNNR